MVDIIFNSCSDKIFNKLPKDVKDRILKKIRFYSDNFNIMLFAKKLNYPGNYHRLRIGDYRVIFYMREYSIVIVDLAHRKDIYKNLDFHSEHE